MVEPDIWPEKGRRVLLNTPGTFTDFLYLVTHVERKYENLN